MFNFFISFTDFLGKKVIEKVNLTGEFFLFVFSCISIFVRSDLNRKRLVNEMYLVSIKSIGVILLTGSSAGLALALQSYIGFIRVQAEQFTGLVATLGIVRELGPVLTGLLVAAKTGSSFAAEIATMKITEQVDALKTLCINPINYLVVPKIIATTIMMPFVTILAMFCGIISSYLLCINVLSINSQAYIDTIQAHLRMNDISGGLIKSVAFGFIIAVVSTYHGYKTIGGAIDVGVSTTRAVVISSILILISNYVLTSFLYNSGML